MLKDSPSNRELCSVLGGSPDGRGIWGRMDPCICMTESLHCSPENIIRLLISYFPIQNKKFFCFLKNLPFDTGDTGSTPGWGVKIPQAVGQLSLHDIRKTQHGQNLKK